MCLSFNVDSATWIVSFAMLGRFGISATYSVVTLYTAELYPTEIRSSALGTCSTWAHVGSITAPYAVDLLVRLIDFDFFFCITYYLLFAILGPTWLVYTNNYMWMLRFSSRPTHTDIT